MKKLIKNCTVFLMSFFIVGLLSACGGGVQEIVEDIIENELPMSDVSDEAVVEADLELLDEGAEGYEEESIEALMEEVDEVPWSGDIPAIFVEFTEGYCISSNHMKDTEDNVWIVTYVDVLLDEVEAYNKTLEKEGWQSDDYVDGLMYAYTKEDYETTITIGSDEDGSLWYTLYLSHEEVNESGSDLNHMDGGDIPSGYPANELPIYESSTSVLIGAVEISAGDSIIYTIEIGCDETPEEIVDELYPYLEKLNKEKVRRMLMDGNGLLQGSSDTWYYTIIIEGVEYQGKATSIVYQVTPLVE